MTSQNIRIHNLRDEIDSLHLSYLKTEECLNKFREQQKLEVVIKEYLSNVAHIQKFFFPKIANVLHSTIMEKKDFSPFKVISGWSALAKYAHNISTQPWRKEFYTIQKYGGYFTHVIKDILVDWEIVFKLMGYNTSKDIMILQEPIDPDKINYVARDCIVAQVECKIMMKIYESVLKIHNDCTWQDILELREKKICSEEEAIRFLCSVFMQRQEEYVQETLIPPPGHPFATLPSYHSNPCLRYNDYKQMHPYGNSGVGISSYPKMGGHERCDFNHFMTPEYPYPNCAKHVPNHFQINGGGNYSQHYQGNGYGMQYTDRSMCPQYIYPCNMQYVGLDMDERDHCSNCHGYNCGTIYPFVFPNNKYTDQAHENHKQRSKNVGKCDHLAKQTSTDYQQRRNKDSLLGSNVKYTPVTVDLDNVMKAYSYDFDKTTVSDNELSDKSQFDNVPSDNMPTPCKNTEKFEKRETLASNLWECKFCTFHNSTVQNICELCDKSRNVGNEKIPLISGGRQCQKCTLVNERDAVRCQACSNGLKDSATYI